MARVSLNLLTRYLPTSSLGMLAFRLRRPGQRNRTQNCVPSCGNSGLCQRGQIESFTSLRSTLCHGFRKWPRASLKTPGALASVTHWCTGSRRTRYSHCLVGEDVVAARSDDDYRWWLATVYARVADSRT